VQVKDLILGARIAETATHEEWKDQPAQFECPRGDMVARCAASSGGVMADAAVRAEAQRLRAAFEAAGAVPVEADILQPAETLLDLYGEDIRARAYVTSDPVRGEMMLRPDFTVPVVQMHMANGGADPRATPMRARSSASRRRDRPARRNTSRWATSSSTDRPGAGRCRGLRALRRGAGAAGLRAATGDIGLLRAAVMGLSTTETRKAALCAISGGRGGSGR
jgi:hypothetical protein